jgi:hypothetical protein
VKLNLNDHENPQFEEEQYLEEEDFMSEMADCVGKLGTWSLELYKNHEKILENQELCQAYNYVY